MQLKTFCRPYPWLRDAASAAMKKHTLIPHAARVMLLIFVICVNVAPLFSAEGKRHWWPQFRGPGSSGVAQDGEYPKAIDPHDNLAWRTTIPSGVSSPCIWEDRIFLTAYDQQREVLETLCLSRSDGDMLWRREVPTKEFESRVHPTNSLASATPVTDGKWVYVYFGSFGLLCYDFAGDLKWERRLGVARNRWGMGTSPILVSNKLVLSCDQGDFRQQEDGPISFLLAVDPSNGDTIWKTDRPAVRSGWSTPFIWNRGETTDLITYSNTRITAFGLDNGESRWTVTGLPLDSVATPVTGSDLLFVSGTVIGGDVERPIRLPSFDEFLEQHDEDGDNHLAVEEMPDGSLDPRGRSGTAIISFKRIFGFLDADKSKLVSKMEWEELDNKLPQFFKQSDALLAIRPGGSGDVTETNIAWTAKRGIPDNPSPLYLNERVYLAKSGGIISCFAAASGKILYRRRAGVQGNISASPVAASGKIYVCSERGDVAVLEDGNEFSELSRGRLGERIMATPALADGNIYIRTDDHLYAFAKE